MENSRALKSLCPGAKGLGIYYDWVSSAHPGFELILALMKCNVMVSLGLRNALHLELRD